MDHNTPETPLEMQIGTTSDASNSNTGVVQTTPRQEDTLEKKAAWNSTLKPEVETPDKAKRPWNKELLQIVEEQWFLLALGILIAIASQVQVPLPQQRLKRTAVSYLCISIIFFMYVHCYMKTKRALC